MLDGTNVTLRMVWESDVDLLFEQHLNSANRRDLFPRSVPCRTASQTAFQSEFQESGFWGNDHGMLVMISPADNVIGHIEFYKTVNYLDEYELSYQMYALDQRGKVMASESINLVVRYLFNTKRMNRIRMLIHPDNTGSRRIAERCGFQHEGSARGAWYNRGRHHDVEMYAILHDDIIH